MQSDRLKSYLIKLVCLGEARQIYLERGDWRSMVSTSLEIDEQIDIILSMTQDSEGA